MIDDGSTDDTADVARSCGVDHVVRFRAHKGLAAAFMTGLDAALKLGADIIVNTDADGQHRAALAPRLVARLGEYDLVVGARHDATQATFGRRVGNLILARLASFLTGRKIPDLTSGFRAARTSYLLEFIHMLPNGFSTPTTTTLAFIRAGYNVAFETADADARVGRSKIRFARDGFKF